MAEEGLKRGKGNWRTKPHLAGVPFHRSVGRRRLVSICGSENE